MGAEKHKNKPDLSDCDEVERCFMQVIAGYHKMDHCAMTSHESYIRSKVVYAQSVAYVMENVVGGKDSNLSSAQNQEHL